MDEQPNNDIVTQDAQFSSQNTQPSAESTNNAQQPQETPENIILSDTGYLQNLFQRSLKAQGITLTLYKSHLRFTDAQSGEQLDDVAINMIAKTSRYFSNRFTYTLYGLLFPTTLVIKTAAKKYKISWVNRDKESILLGGTPASVLSSQQNYTKNMQWVKAIQDLKKGTN